MPNNLNYHDFYRFLVSLGLILIVLSMAIPYFYLSSDFGIYIDQKNVKTFSAVAQQIILEREETIVTLRPYVIWASGGLAFLGFLISAIGLRKWYHHQRDIEDKMKKVELSIKEKQLEGLEAIPPQQKEKETEKEIRETGKIDDSQLPVAVAQYFDIETKVTDRLTEIFEDHYKSFRNVSLNGLSIDLFLTPKTAGYTARVGEVKWFREKVEEKFIEEAVQTLGDVVASSRKSNKRELIPMLIIVVNKNLDPFEKIKETVQQKAGRYHELGKLKVKVISEDEISQLDAMSLV